MIEECQYGADCRYSHDLTVAAEETPAKKDATPAAAPAKAPAKTAAPAKAAAKTAAPKVSPTYFVSLFIERE
jgi:3-oxoacyl-ACP reductase-like protein